MEMEYLECYLKNLLEQVTKYEGKVRGDIRLNDIPFSCLRAEVTNQLKSFSRFKGKQVDPSEEWGDSDYYEERYYSPDYYESSEEV